MLAAVRSAAVQGIRAFGVTVEVDSSPGLPHFAIVGLPAGAVKESRERVGAALVNSGFVLPPRRITVNLAPADIRKDGTAFDLPIAIGVLVATGQLGVRRGFLSGVVCMGELGLDGSLRPVRGILSVARSIGRGEVLVVPSSNAAEAAIVRGVRVSAPGSLREFAEQVGRGEVPIVASQVEVGRAGVAGVDFAEVAGQVGVKRALEIAAAGGHALLMVGPPGAGKTMLARRLPTILPSPTEEEALDILAVHSVAGLLVGGGAVLPSRPFRAPHHTVSLAGLVGGGSPPRPGEVSLAHNGVLFLDEMLEFPRSVLDALRQPLEDGRVVVSRVGGSATFPSRFTLVGAMNPCLCGRAGTSRAAECTCTPSAVQRYRSRLSGPLRDRMDLVVQVGALPLCELGSAGAAGEGSAAYRSRVERARARQLARYASCRGVACNAQASGGWVAANVRVEPAARALLMRAAEQLELSARGYHRVLKVALTVSDLAGEGCITTAALAEALQYR